MSFKTGFKALAGDLVAVFLAIILFFIVSALINFSILDLMEKYPLAFVFVVFFGMIWFKGAILKWLWGWD